LAFHSIKCTTISGDGHGIITSNDAGYAARSRPRVATVLRLEEGRRYPRPIA
jgi:hypothetical protein